jgi:hypothetical protein
VRDSVMHMIYLVYSAYFGGSPFGEAVKTCSGKKINKTIILTDKIRGHPPVAGRIRGPIYSSVTCHQ